MGYITPWECRNYHEPPVESEVGAMIGYILGWLLFASIAVSPLLGILLAMKLLG